MGRTPACPGCEAMFITGEPARPHSSECWERITQILEETDDGKATLARAKTRMEQYRRIISDNVAPSGADIPAPPPPVAWPAANEVEGAESDGDDVEQPGLSSIEAFIDAVHARYISCKPDCKQNPAIPSSSLSVPL